MRRTHVSSEYSYAVCRNASNDKSKLKGTETFVKSPFKVSHPLPERRS